ncbi:ribonuclease HII [Natronobacterium gregoryi]|uniref:Ribonuclease HII n=2 Tax=Natronobacterium gregoryi TaxID=44930 RepID=L0AEJ8_NATGS|nr:ribonuclease HII [Natronobacterium gregoryi]AFZ72251.1 ribonuclease H, mammalian HI/archaeal HII subfamily [Natronobacterium gregoryi SP2]ELY62349.1 ribonuclease HII [Natronobacterium gregoryi SP2]PLK20198.1 ribonuclease HII [Natronobacterium gregoryi SP2]SFJ28955.1 RNase HII [Natronobacterium gregoryi]
MPFGVDEAGKGPVLGSMFAAAVYVPEAAALPDGIADSKRLAPEHREKLAATLREDDRFGIGVAEISTGRIDEPTTDMNSLTVEAHANAIEAALEDCALENDSVDGLCDACDTDANRFARRVADAASLSRDLDLEARHGADDDSPVVGAASIVAKVERDAHVAAISEEYGDVGSGYPSDPTTREFLESYVDDHGELPPFARSSWSTCEKALASAQQTGLEQF